MKLFKGRFYASLLKDSENTCKRLDFKADDRFIIEDGPDGESFFSCYRGKKPIDFRLDRSCEYGEHVNVRVSDLHQIHFRNTDGKEEYIFMGVIVSPLGDKDRKKVTGRYILKEHTGWLAVSNDCS